jgi:NitT/TauT family transport system substrate-binding protein
MNFSRSRAAALLALGAVAACSRSGQNGEVRIAVTRGSLTYLPVHVAGPVGCFAQEGVEVSLEGTDGSSKSAQALMGGSVHAAAFGYLQVLDLQAKGQDPKAFVAMQDAPGMVAIISPKASRPVKELKNLVGANVGVTSLGNDHHRMFTYMLARAGIRPEDVTVVATGGAGSTAAALERGLIDLALSTTFTFHHVAQSYPHLERLFETTTRESARKALGVEVMPVSLLVAREAWLQSNPDKARKLAASMQCALSWIHGHTPEQIYEVLPEAWRSPFPKVDMATIADVKRALLKDGRMTEEMHDATVAILRGSGSSDSYRIAFTNEFLRP